jgi:Flp pilus assembly protein TadB
MLNIALVFLLASLTVMVALFAYKKYCVKESQETKRMDEAKRELLKTEKERENARITEETGYSERDEYEDDDSDDDEE